MPQGIPAVDEVKSSTLPPTRPWSLRQMSCPAMFRSSSSKKLPSHSNTSKEHSSSSKSLVLPSNGRPAVPHAIAPQGSQASSVTTGGQSIKPSQSLLNPPCNSSQSSATHEPRDSATVGAAPRRHARRPGILLRLGDQARERDRSILARWWKSGRTGLTPAQDVTAEDKRLE